MARKTKENVERTIPEEVELIPVKAVRDELDKVWGEVRALRAQVAHLNSKVLEVPKDREQESRMRFG